MNWLITGGCGFIGRKVIKDLVNEGGHNIRVVDNLSVGTREELGSVCTFVEGNQPTPFRDEGAVQLIAGDILDEALAVSCCDGIDVLLHLAANTGVPLSVENPRKDCVTNVIGTFNYLEGARIHKVKRFIFASSGAPAGECTPPIHEEMPPHPVSPYGASKLAGEGYCSAYSRTFDIETVVLRFSNVYGPFSGKKNSVVAKFIKKIESNEPVIIYGDGSQTRDFLYINDLVKGIRIAAEKPGIGGETFQIATSEETTVGWIAEHLVNIYAKKDPTKSIKLEYAEKRLGDVKRNFSDTTKAKNILGWQAETTLEEGLLKTVNWYRGLAIEKS